MEEIKTVHILVSGRVQGVYYRASCVDKARNLGLSGWVRNLPDNRVEIMASGGVEKMDLFIKWCAQGPSGAKVENLFVEEKPYQWFENFTILRL